jgi:pimeloyl-ACP methyl ester carboxylesterase
MSTYTSSAATNAQPQTGKAKSRVWLWLKRGLFNLLFLVIAVALMGAVYQIIATAVDQRAYPPAGQMIEVGGYSLHLYCTGVNTDGRPTVILEPGLGATSAAWAWVQPEVAKTTRVCAYDRAGLGWSHASPQPRDAQHIASELHMLLQNAKIPGPYVLVGWSYGGLYIRAYADQYREETAGLVLLDSSSPQQCTSTPAGEARCASDTKIYALAPILARLGVMRIRNLFQPASGLPTPQHDAFLASFSATKDWDAQSAEFLASPATNTQVLNSKALGDIPLFVLTATDHGTPPDLEQLWQDWQTGFTELSTNSVQRILHGATHTSIVFDSTDAKVTIEAILEVVEAARGGNSLKP